MFFYMGNKELYFLKGSVSHACDIGMTSGEVWVDGRD